MYCAENITVSICITIGVCFCVYFLSTAFKEIGKIAFNNTQQGGAKSFGLLYERILKVVVVLAVVVAIIVLGLSGIIKGESIIILLSSLVSFALGSLVTKNKNDLDN